MAAVLACAGAAAHAHRFHAAISDITANERSGSVEIVHTLMAHDVENLLQNLYQREIDLADQEGERLLRRYIEKQFVVLGADGKALPLRWVGVKLDTESITIYQELERTPIARAVRLHNAILSDFLEDQVNTVNMRQTSLTFTRQVQELALP